MNEADDRGPDPLQGWVDDDLADRLAGAERTDIDVEATELAVAEAAAVSWTLRAPVDSSQVGLTVLGGAEAPPLVGAVVDVGSGWLQLRTRSHDVVVSTTAVLAITGLSRLSTAPGSASLQSRAIGAPLRALAASARSVVLLRVDGVRLEGSLGRVGLDAVDLTLHPVDRPVRPSDRVVTVPFAALSTVTAG